MSTLRAAWLLPLGALLLTGCPKKTEPEKTTAEAKTRTAAKSPGRSAPKQSLREAWEEDLRKRPWAGQVVARLKQKGEKQKLSRPFDDADPALIRLTLLTRYLRVWDGELKRAVPLSRVLRLHLRKNQTLDPGFFAEDQPRTVGILVLQDSAFLYSQPILATTKGWVSIRSGLQQKTFDAQIAAELLRAAHAARDGQWKDATDRYGKAFLELCRRNTAARGTPGLASAWKKAEGLFAQGDPQDLEQALRAWSLAFLAKPKGAKKKG